MCLLFYCVQEGGEGRVAGAGVAVDFLDFPAEASSRDHGPCKALLVLGQVTFFCCDIIGLCLVMLLMREALAFLL